MFLHYLSLLFGGWGGVRGFLYYIMKKKCLFHYLPMIINFLTLDEILFGVSDLGM